MNAQPQGVRRRQTGQAVVWFLATMAACCATFALVYNVGQVANKKEETTNAADAAALSGALVEARMLNFNAYTNRALVANEVTIAQLISIDSWIQYDYELTNWIATYTAIIPFVNSITSGIKTAVYAVHTGVHAAVSAAVPALDVLTMGLNASRELIHNTGAIAAHSVSSDIAAANATTFNGRTDSSPRLGVGQAALVANQLSWGRFTQRNGGNDRGNGAAVVMNSRDEFSTDREEGLAIDGINLIMKAAGAFIDYNELDKTSGSTQLVDYDHWVAQDSIDLKHTGVEFCFGIPCGYGTDPIPVPLGYGRVEAGGNSDKNLCKEFSFTLFASEPLPTLNCQMSEWYEKSVSWQGLPSFRDLRPNQSNNDPCSVNNASDSPSLTYVMAVEKPGRGTLTTQRLGFNDVPVNGPQGSPQMTDNLQNGDSLTAISAACVFFLRPDRTDPTGGFMARRDGKHELASLYNPYWQARLTAPSDTWKAATYAAMGKPLLDQVLR